MTLGIILCPRCCGGTRQAALWVLPEAVELAKLHTSPCSEVWRVSVVPNVISRLSHCLPLSCHLEEAHSPAENNFLIIA